MIRLQARVNSSLSLQWAILVGALLAMGVALGLNLYLDHERIRVREQERLLAQGEIVERIVNKEFTSLNTVLGHLAADWAEPRAGQAFSDRLKVLDEGMPGVRTLLVLDAQGLVRASSRPELLGKDFSGREYFKTVQARHDPEMLFVSPPFRTSLGVYSINTSRMIRGPKNEFLGIVSATLDPSYFAPLLDSILYAPGMWAHLVHGDGDVFLVLPERGNVEGKNLAQPGTLFTRHMESGQQASVFSDTVWVTGERRMLAAHTILPSGLRMDKPLVVGVARDLDLIYAPWRRGAALQGGLYLLLVLAGCAGLQLSQNRQRALARQEAQSAQAMLDNERFIHMVADNIPGMVGYWDRGLRCRFANRAYFEWFGKTREQILGLGIQDLLGPELFRKNEPHLRAALRGEPQRFERILARTDGNVGYTMAYYIPDAVGGTVWGFFVLVADVTELKLAQLHLEDRVAERTKELAESEAFTRAIIASSPDCIKLLDQEGGLVFMSEGGLRLMELDSADLVLGRSYLDFWSGSDHERAAAALEEARAGRVGRFEGFCATHQGTPKWWDVTLSPMPDKPMPDRARFLVVSRDITERKGIELRLVSAMQQAEAGNRAKAAFLANLSHELRTPLNPIVGLTDLMLSTECSAELQRDYLQEVRAASRRLLRLFNGLFETLDLDSYAPLQDAVGLVAFQQMVLQSLTPAAQAKGLDLGGSVAPDLPPFVWADMHLLRMVLLEFGENAVRFTPAGRVSVDITLRGEQGERLLVEFAVEDTGIGIPEDRLEAIRTGLTQSDEPLAKRYSGLGVGIAKVTRAVALLGGRIEIVSHLGQGSRFSAVVPVTRAEPADDTAASVASPTGESS